MKKAGLIASMILALAATAGNLSNAQPFGESGLSKLETGIRQTGIPNEKLQLLTDRNIYAVGEKIMFRSFNLSLHAMKSAGWSKVMYLDLIDADNKSVAHGKYPLSSYGSHGSITVPPTAGTGNYYLVASTKWMRNFGLAEYSIIPLTIINPYNSEIIGARAGYEITGTPDKDSIITQSGEENGQSGRENIDPADQELNLITNKPEYDVRSKVEARFLVPADPGYSSEGYCISVVSAGAAFRGSAISQPSTQEFLIQKDDVKYFPESGGLSLSGQVVKNDRKDPVAFAQVHFSTFGTQTDYARFTADVEGKFSILIPEGEGLQNLFIGTDPTGDEDLEILIDNDFAADYSDLAPMPFRLSEEIQRIARDIIFSAQLENAYATPVAADSSGGGKIMGKGKNALIRRPFYGQAPIILDVDDYVALPALEEFFIELIPEVSIRKRRDKIEFTMTGVHTDLMIYPTLVLYDLVPVFNLDAFLKLSPENIKRIEVVNATYQRGDLTFGGIISVFSRDGNLGGLDLQAGSFFFDFEAFHKSVPNTSNDYSSGPGDLHIPDYRNTLYWNPVLKGQPGETVAIEFYTPDRPGDYIINVWGQSPSGKFLHGQSRFIVRLNNL